MYGIYKHDESYESDFYRIILNHFIPNNCFLPILIMKKLTYSKYYDTLQREGFYLIVMHSPIAPNFTLELAHLHCPSALKASLSRLL